MTLLIAVLAEAYEKSYKNAVHKQGLNRAMKNLRRHSEDRMMSRTNTLSSGISIARTDTMMSTMSMDASEKGDYGSGSVSQMTIQQPEAMEAHDVHYEVSLFKKGFN